MFLSIVTDPLFQIFYKPSKILFNEISYPSKLVYWTVYSVNFTREFVCSNSYIFYRYGHFVKNENFYKHKF